MTNSIGTRQPEVIMKALEQHNPPHRHMLLWDLQAIWVTKTISCFK